MKELPLISIIIPTYNRAHIIGETLDAIIAQTYSRWECIVVDDGSTDNTDEVLERYIKKDSRFQYYTRPKDRKKGPCSCRNFGFEKSKGDYVNFFDSDDLLKADAFETCLTNFLEETDGVIMNNVLTDFNTGKHLSSNSIQSANLLTDYFIGKITFLVCGPLWRRSFLEKQPYLFDETIRNVDDWDFNLRMLYANPQLIYLDDILIYYRKNHGSFSEEVRKLNKEEILSDFKARDKQLKLFKDFGYDINHQIKNYIITRYSKHLRIALRENAAVRSLLFKKLLKQSLAFSYYIQAVRFSFGYGLFIYFKRGMKYLKFNTK
ncbi:glycosyltransferase [Lacinutrix sp. WUR7]|uniref:glycosyltransferase family 2 protein n=1 Tax=Lacinutrix sp. WUR7 TaxID=2653681 RepID=UPI00193DB04A|nr:glycosyltransferase family 2 protein [Lacinutrix sp. WUR7]QRM87796.1 glycosyltransferase [Lacinutrix sp. WUR7]